MSVLGDLFALFEPATWAFILFAAFSTAAFHAVAGLGGVLLLSALLTPALGVKVVIPVLSVAAIIGNATRLYLFRHATQWWAVRAIMITGLPAIILGASIYTWLPAKAIAAIMGAFLIVSVPLRRHLKKREFVVGKKGLSGVGAVFGLFGGTVIGAGLILAPFLLGAGVVGELLIGTVAALGFILNVTKAAVFGTTQLVGTQLFMVGVLVGLAMIPGAWLGRLIVRKTSIQLHTVFVEFLIVIGGLFFFWQALKPD